MTLRSWINRENVIPETGKPLKELLQEARAEYRRQQREERQEALVDQAEKKFKEISKAPVSQPLKDKNDKYRRDENGKILRYYRPDVMSVQADVAKFVAERLDPENYSQKSQTENKHLVFSLAELRRAKEGGDENQE